MYAIVEWKSWVSQRQMLVQKIKNTTAKYRIYASIDKWGIHQKN